jgi:carbohydrate-binding DOMON domain-containing protein
MIHKLYFLFFLIPLLASCSDVTSKVTIRQVGGVTQTTVTTVDTLTGDEKIETTCTYKGEIYDCIGGDK